MKTGKSLKAFENTAGPTETKGIPVGFAGINGRKHRDSDGLTSNAMKLWTVGCKRPSSSRLYHAHNMQHTRTLQFTLTFICVTLQTLLHELM